MKVDHLILFFVDHSDFLGLYDGHLQAQQKDILLFKKEEDTLIPEDFDFKSISLSNEAYERINKYRPKSIVSPGMRF